MLQEVSTGEGLAGVIDGLEQIVVAGDRPLEMPIERIAPQLEGTAMAYSQDFRLEN